MGGLDAGLLLLRGEVAPVVLGALSWVGVDIGVEVEAPPAVVEVGEVVGGDVEQGCVVSRVMGFFLLGGKSGGSRPEGLL